MFRSQLSVNWFNKPASHYHISVQIVEIWKHNLILWIILVWTHIPVLSITNLVSTSHHQPVLHINMVWEREQTKNGFDIQLLSDYITLHHNTAMLRNYFNEYYQPAVNTSRNTVSQTNQLIQSMAQCLQSKQGRHGLSLIYNFIVSVFVARINTLKIASHNDPPTPDLTSQNRMKNLLFSHLQRCNISAQTYFL